MKFITKSDVIQLCLGLVNSLQSFAKSNQVELKFNKNLSKLLIEYSPEELLPDLSRLLCRIIAFTPQGYSVKLSCKTRSLKNIYHLIINVSNDGANLVRVNEIISGLENHINVISQEGNETLFQMHIPIEKPVRQTGSFSSTKINHHNIPPYYFEIQKQLQSHFANIENLEKFAAAKSQHQGIFLQKLNALILSHLSEEGYNTNCLCNGMALSRSQLYRKLKELTHMPPAHYIQFIRLQKAREYLQNTDMNVGEVVVKVGFASHSHFTRAFNDHFGINPSLLKQPVVNKNET